MSDGRANWGSRLGFILASAGSAVGLGAIWKFPYVAGQNGGGAFLLVYFACVATLGLALLYAEMLIGRSARRSATTAFRQLGGAGWAWAGRLSVLCLYCILSFYCVVGGWTLAYLAAVLDPAFLRQDAAALAAHFSAFTASPLANGGHALLFLGITAAVVLAGVEKGIERMSKVLLPALFLLLLLLIARVLSLPGASEGLRYFLAPDFSRASADMVVQALGLAFFSLSLGCGVIVAYGSYLRPPAEGGSRLLPATLWVAVLATLACVLAGLLILPAVFAFGLDPEAGPGLTFITMPSILAIMPF
ncbi:MAG: sodium-dependent transporter, partial [Moraxellaceae bacterium]